VPLSDAEGGAHEERLIDEIFEHRRYIKYARPVLEETDALNVAFGISLQQIIDVVSHAVIVKIRRKTRARELIKTATGVLSPVRTGVIGDYSRQCGQGFMGPRIRAFRRTGVRYVRGSNFAKILLKR